MPECPDLFTLTFREEQSPAPGECQSGHDLTLSYCHCDIPVTSVQSLSSHPMLVYCSTMQSTTALTVHCLCHQNIWSLEPNVIIIWPDFLEATFSMVHGVRMAGLHPCFIGNPPPMSLCSLIDGVRSLCGVDVPTGQFSLVMWSLCLPGVVQELLVVCSKSGDICCSCCELSCP